MASRCQSLGFPSHLHPYNPRHAPTSSQRSRINFAAWRIKAANSGTKPTEDKPDKDDQFRILLDAYDGVQRVQDSNGGLGLRMKRYASYLKYDLQQLNSFMMALCQMMQLLTKYSHPLHYRLYLD